MKHLLTIILFSLPYLSFSQDVIFDYPNKEQVDSLQLVLQQTNNDTLQMLVCRKLGSYFIERNNTVAAGYHTKEIALARKLNQSFWEAEAYNELCYEAYESGDYPQSLNLANAGIQIANNEDCEKNLWKPTEFAKDGDPHKARLYLLAVLYEKLGYLYLKTGNNVKCSSSYFKALEIAASVDDKVGLSFYDEDLGDYYLEVNKLDSALLFTNKGLEYAESSGYKLYQGALLANVGQVYFRKGDYSSAKKYYFNSIKANEEQNNERYLPRTYILLADLYRTIGKSDSAVYYSTAALKGFIAVDDKPEINEAYVALFAAYKMVGNRDSAFVYLQRSKVLSDSLHAIEKEKLSQYLSVGFNNQLKVQELEKDKIQAQTRNRTYVMLTGISIVIIIALILYRNNKQKQKANLVLQKTLSELKSTQAQLIQSGKMASLGELTAGIAHEIQNPLNFVNNFSEVSNELVDEMKEELNKGDVDEAKFIADDIKQNLEKINHHGKRADAIVKNMLQHSRQTKGVKEPTDINALCDEYLRLSYYGLRAKDKNFNADIKMDFDESIGKINVVPQDIGRVLLNLFNNAFYAVNEKKKLTANSYQPIAEVKTRKINDKVEIIVSDNGNGIPQNIIDKIFQPFFTTKPTGQGTGLGLSLAYDIITKEHNGTIKVESKEGGGSKFIIMLSQ